jgi:hypothetical protein
MGKPVTITLTVSASQLFAIANPTSQQVDNCCGLSDDNNGSIPSGGTIDDFTSNVYAGHSVTWIGNPSTNPSDNGYNVAIDSISNNASFFPTNPVNGNGGRSGRVSGTLNSGVNGATDTYTINFTIYAPGNGGQQSYSIDPKLQGNN